MPKKGGKTQRRGKKPQQQDDRSTIVFKEDGEEYAKVIRSLGNGRLEVQLPDRSTKLANIRGKLRRRKTWINTGDVVLVAIREYQEDRCDVLFTYSPTQLQILKKRKLLPEAFNQGQNDNPTDGANNGLDIDFCDLSDNEDDNIIQTSTDLNNNRLSLVKESPDKSVSTTEEEEEEEDDFVFDDI
jgi:translation initiation factor 1A